MRAARLLSLLMLLQARGRMTARALARELEVSERTIYRDLDALSAAGVPVYADRGPGGGCALLPDYRTQLTGLTDDELRALFMVSIPAPLIELGLSHELRAAIHKLAAALPGARRAEEQHVRQRIYLDWSPWFHAVEPVPHLGVVQQAVWQSRRLELTYRLLFDTQATWTVEPLGLVGKAGLWYLVAARDGKPLVYQLARVVEVRGCDQTFERPPDFDLEDFWHSWSIAHEASRAVFPVRLRVAPDLIALLPHYFGTQVQAAIAAAGQPDAHGWRTITLSFESFEAARTRILGFGYAVEVLWPMALRLSVHDFAQQIVAGYRPDARLEPTG